MSNLTKYPVKEFFARDEVKNKFAELLGKRSTGFMTAVLQVCALSDKLAQADPVSVFNAAATAATLDLSVNPNLGQAYIIPYNLKKKNPITGKDEWVSVAQLQIGYKAFIQFAQRTGLFQTISASPVYEGQLVENNPLTGPTFDWSKKTDEKIVGFVAYFRLLNGFEKYLYMTTEEMNQHGAKYSKTFSYNDSLWKKDFVGMGNKTVIKLLLSKFAPLSVEMQVHQAIKFDQAVVTDLEQEEVVYPDNATDAAVVVDQDSERFLALIKSCTTMESLLVYETMLPDFPEHTEVFNQIKLSLQTP
jgi:recombination protein RecT